MGDSLVFPRRDATRGDPYASIFPLRSLVLRLFGVGRSVRVNRFCQTDDRIKEDTVIGLVFTGFFGLMALVLVVKYAATSDLHPIFFQRPMCLLGMQ